MCKPVKTVRAIIAVLIAAFMIIGSAACGAGTQPGSRDNGQSSVGTSDVLQPGEQTPETVDNGKLPSDTGNNGTQASDKGQPGTQPSDNGQSGSQPSDTELEKVSVTLYFANSNADAVAAEKRLITLKKNEPIEKAIFEELMAGPSTAGLHAVIPKGTKLLSLSVKDGLCTIDLSKEFVDNSPGGTASELMTIFSVVNTLTELDHIQKVQFLIESEKREVYTHMIFDEPIERNEDIIGK